MRTTRARVLLLLLLPTLPAACTAAGDDDNDGTPDPCPRVAAPADRERFVVVARPYDAGGGPANRYEVLPLGANGVLGTGAVSSFSMGRAFAGEIAFTPDGEVGLLAQDDGTIGVFTLDSAGNAAVVHAGYSGGFYASRVIVEEGGRRAFVLDSQTLGNGGGAYSVDIGCDGSLSNERLLLAADLLYDIAPLGGDEWLGYARSIPGTTAGDDVHHLTLGSGFTPGPGLDAFPSDEDAIVYDLAVTVEGALAFAADANLFGTGNRVAVVDLDPFTRVAELSVQDPLSIAVSPHGDAFLVVSFEGDALWAGTYDGGGVGTFAELAYAGGGPQLPANAVTITRGSLAGLTLVAENLGVRRVRFEGNGVVTDLGRVPLGAGTESIIGAIGVQP